MSLDFGKTHSVSIKILIMLDDNDFALASAVDTSVVVLEELSLHPQPEVREAVAINPNTPTEVLLKLGKEFPEAMPESLQR